MNLDFWNSKIVPLEAEIKFFELPRPSQNMDKALQGAVFNAIFSGTFAFLAHWVQSLVELNHNTCQALAMESMIIRLKRMHFAD